MRELAMGYANCYVGYGHGTGMLIDQDKKKSVSLKEFLK